MRPQLLYTTQKTHITPINETSSPLPVLHPTQGLVCDNSTDDRRRHSLKLWELATFSGAALTYGLVLLITTVTLK